MIQKVSGQVYLNLVNFVKLLNGEILIMENCVCMYACMYVMYVCDPARVAAPVRT